MIGALRGEIEKVNKELRQRQQLAVKEKYDRFLASREAAFCPDPVYREPNFKQPKSMTVDEQVALRVKLAAWRLPPPPCNERLHAAAEWNHGQPFGLRRVAPEPNRKYSNSRVGEYAAPAQVGRGFAIHTCLFDTDSLHCEVDIEDLARQEHLDEEWWDGRAVGDIDAWRGMRELNQMNNERRGLSRTRYAQ